MYIYLDGISWRGGAFYLKKLRSSSIVAHTEQRRIALWAPLIQGGASVYSLTEQFHRHATKAWFPCGRKIYTVKTDRLK